MRIIINGRFLAQKITGINRFALEMCKELSHRGLEFEVLIPAWLDVSNMDIPFKIISYGKNKSHLWEQIDLFRYLNRNGNPLLINFSGLGPLLYRNQVISIHDLSFYVKPEWFSLSYRLLYHYATPVLAKKSLAVITVSEFSKSEIIKYLKIAENKVFVIPNAVSICTTRVEDDCSITIPTESKFILAVSSIDPRKNHHNLIKAFDSPEFDNYSLYIVGKSSSNFNVKHQVVNRDNIRYLGYVSDTCLATLYSKAHLFVYPSLYEGFGLPPIEAMMMGCPTVVSDIPSLRETCKYGAYFVDPENIFDIRKGILCILNEQSLRTQLIDTGMKIATSYSWKESASKFLKLLELIKT